jgi:hypothetical protein
MHPSCLLGREGQGKSCNLAQQPQALRLFKSGLACRMILCQWAHKRAHLTTSAVEAAQWRRRLLPWGCLDDCQALFLQPAARSHREGRRC